MKSISRITPFLLKPVAKSYIWGGNRLNDDFSKDFDGDNIAETWECSTHQDGISIVASGCYTGMDLTTVLKKHPEYIGNNSYNTMGKLPIIVKLIDAKKDLSVQVHPDDKYAFDNENGSFGKDEMWYVIDAKKDAALTYGFHNSITKNQLVNGINNGQIEKYLQKVKVKKDDVFYIPAGCVHAIGEGILLAEIQESSNITYRLYDYNRTDKSGKKRELHIQKALDVANLSGTELPKQPMRVLKFKKGFATELLCRCKYFEVERLLLNTERQRKMAMIESCKDTFQILLCIDGCGVISGTENFSINFFKGDCIFIPANSENFIVHGKAIFLKVRC